MGGRKSRSGPAGSGLFLGKPAGKEAQALGAPVTRWRCGSMPRDEDLGYKPSKHRVSVLCSHTLLNGFQLANHLQALPRLQQVSGVGAGLSTPPAAWTGGAHVSKPLLRSQHDGAGDDENDPSQSPLPWGACGPAPSQPVRIWPPEPAPREAAWSPQVLWAQEGARGAPLICPPTSSRG